MAFVADEPLYLTPTKLRRVNREFVRYVRGHFPMRFYSGEPWWTVSAAAALLRMCDTVEGMMLLMARRKDGDALILLRSLYEQVVLFAWVAIDPDDRHTRWEGESNKQMLKLHNEVLPYGETILSPAEVAICEAATGTPSVATMAHELDEYWPSHVDGLYAAGHLFSFHGFYQSIYRIGSRPAHASLESLEPYVRRTPYPLTVAEREDDPMLWYSLAAPLFGLCLVIASRRFHWIDAVRVRRLVDRATAETVRRRGH
jgi:Family of unknown function (DUF5677)